MRVAERRDGLRSSVALLEEDREQADGKAAAQVLMSHLVGESAGAIEQQPGAQVTVPDSSRLDHKRVVFLVNGGARDDGDVADEGGGDYPIEREHAPVGWLVEPD